MPDYQNGKIYKIESLIGNCIYYGSTTQKYLSTRLATHKRDIKYGKGVSSYKVLQYDDAKIYLVELYPCNSKDELHKREGWYIKNNECVNKMVAGRTKKEWRDDNKEIIKRKKKEYYDKIKNTDKYKNNVKQYRDDNKEKHKIYDKRYYIKNKEKYKKYRMDNKEKINKRYRQYSKQYRIDNKEKIKELNSKQYICDCGSIYTYNHHKRHTKTKKHISYMNNPFINFKL